jgi:hypothetical protein
MLFSVYNVKISKKINLFNKIIRNIFINTNFLKFFNIRYFLDQEFQC